MDIPAPSNENGPTLDSILARGLHEPLSDLEIHVVMTHVVTVQRRNAALRGDIETCLALRQGGPHEDLLA